MIQLMPKVTVSLDVAALRHCEHIANSGWCSCSADYALRCTPCKPDTVAEMHGLLGKCVSPTRLARYILSHNPLPGETLPRPCTAEGCTFAHDPATAAAELAELLATRNNDAGRYQQKRASEVFEMAHDAREEPR